MNDRIEAKAEIIEICDPVSLPNAPLVSVVILTYNHEDYIAECIESVVEQECNFDFEIIIAEDCSTDKTLNISKEYQKTYPDRIKVLTSNRNVGIYKNYMRAVNYCKGAYVAFCEGDDFWVDSNKLDIQVNSMIAEGEVNISFHSTFFLDDRRSTEHGPHLRASSRTCVVTEEQVLRGGGSFMPTASIVVSKTILQKLPPWIEDAGGSIDVYVQAYGSREKGALYIDRPMCVYRRRVPGSWATLQNADILRKIEYKLRRLQSLSCMKEEFQASLVDSLIFEEIVEALRILGRMKVSEEYTSAREKIQSYIMEMRGGRKISARIAGVRLFGIVWIECLLTRRRIERLIRRYLLMMGLA